MYPAGKSGGGVVINTTSHLIYALQWFFGVPTQIYARTTRMYSDVEDSCSAIFEYPDGLTGTLDTSWSLPGYRLPGIEVIAEGERGTIELTDYFIKLHLQRGGGGFPEGWTTIHKTELETPSRFEVGGEGFYSEAETFIQSCLSRTAPPVSWKEGYEVQRIVDAIYRSANTGHAVTLV
jgi:predicted dehydrogenase